MTLGVVRRGYKIQCHCVTASMWRVPVPAELDTALFGPDRCET